MFKKLKAAREAVRQSYRESMGGMTFKEKVAQNAAESKAKRDPVLRVQTDYPDAMCIAAGLDGVAFIKGGWLVIKYTHWSGPNRGKGEKRLPLKHITGVKFREATKRRQGFIRFDEAGVSAAQSTILLRSDAVSNENVVTFNMTQMSQFEALRDYIEDLIV